MLKICKGKDNFHKCLEPQGASLHVDRLTSVGQLELLKFTCIWCLDVGLDLTWGP